MHAIFNFFTAICLFIGVNGFAESIELISPDRKAYLESQLLKAPQIQQHFEFSMSLYGLKYTDNPILTSMECDDQKVSEIQPQAADFDSSKYCYFRLNRAYGWYADPEIILTYYGFISRSLVEAGDVDPVSDVIPLRLQLLKPLPTGLE